MVLNPDLLLAWDNLAVAYQRSNDCRNALRAVEKGLTRREAQGSRSVGVAAEVSLNSMAALGLRSDADPLREIPSAGIVHNWCLSALTR